MKRTMLFGTIFSAALAMGANAQTSAGTQPGAQSSGAQHNQQITVTGCLKSGDATASNAAGSTGGGTGTAGAAGTTGAVGASASRDARSGFTLTNAKIGGGSATSGTSGTTGAGATGSTASGASSVGMASTATTFTLQGGSQSDLNKYANSQVEIRGTLDHSAAPSTAAGAGAAGSGATDNTAGTARSSASDTPTLHVNSVRQIAPSCSGS
ncbi:MAG TPA: hypothetical protein VFJ02_18435 [Vicinamibacterales bacterium]|nr:hypothetical protein [Vicinamibacterales bacterium]